MAEIRTGLETQAPGNYPTSLDTRERKVLEAATKNKNVEDTFACQPVVGGFNQATGVSEASEPASGQLLSFMTRRAQYEMYYAAIETTGTAVNKVPTVSADGLELPLDANQTDGPTAIEMGHGTTARSDCAFTVGTSKDFFLEATIKIDDISDITELWMGFRKAEAYQADPDSYDEAAAIHIGDTDDGRISLATILNNAATALADTALSDWTDGAEKTLKVLVLKDRRVKFFIDGVESTAVRFSFDSGEVVVPFLHVDGETGDAGVSISSWRCGYH